MSATQALGRPAAPVMNVFERWLTLWVALCIMDDGKDSVHAFTQAWP